MKFSRKHIAVLLMLAVCVFVVAIFATSGRERTLEGVYQTGPEQSAFFVDGDCSKTPFWFSGPDQLNDDEKAKLRAVGRPEALRLRVLAKLSPIGKYGHLGGYPREVQVTKIISVYAATPCPWPGER